jgi:hypothetical protein
MTHDQIIDEVRALRDEIARQYDYDIDAIFQALREREEESGGGHVRFPPRLVAEETEHTPVPEEAQPSSGSVA